MDDPAIETRDLTKRYGDVTAVQNLDLEVPAAHVFGFLGPNGAGKTTTMELLTGLSEPTAGEARVAGHPTSDRNALKPHVGYVPDEPPVYDAFTGREQLEYVGTIRGLDEQRVAARASDLLDRVGLADDADRRIDTYSQGMRQKISLVQALLHEPSVLFLDEPTTGLDPRAAREVVDMIAELPDDGTTVFLSTHILPVVDELADTVGVLHDGSLVAEGSPSALTERASSADDATLEEAFLAVTDDGAHVGASSDRAATTTAEE